MTIWFSTNIPEMRAISTFKRVSTDISNIQERITTGQRINSGKDDPGGLIIREGLRADIKNIHATQANMVQAENLTDTASNGMMQLLEIIRGSETNNPDDSGLLGALLNAATPADAKTAAEGFMKLYDATVETTLYNGQKLLGGDLKENSGTPGKTYQLGGTQVLGISIGDLSSGSGGAADVVKQAIAGLNATNMESTIGEVKALQTAISTALGTLGGSQKVIAQNQRLLDSRLTSISASEGRISNADIAVESSRMARAELLAQNAMNSIMYTRSYAAFAVSSLFG